MNSVILQGRLGKDPAPKTTGSGKSVLNFSIAVNTNKDNPPIWVDCSAWEKTADVISEYFKKGDGIIVMGSLREESWTDGQTGEQKKKLAVQVREFHFPQGKKTGESQQQPAKKKAPPAWDSQSEVGLEDIPF